MRILLIILSYIGFIFGTNYVTTPYTAGYRTLASSSGYNQNTDSLRIKANEIVDTINDHGSRLVVIEDAYTPWELFSNHDSTFKWMNIDTIDGPVYMDTLKGPVVIDDSLRVDGNMHMKSFFLNYGGNFAGLYFNSGNKATYYGGPDISGDGRSSMYLSDSASWAQGVGGGISFVGKVNAVSGGTFANICGVKANAVEGNYAGLLKFQVKTYAGALTNAATLDSVGNFTVAGDMETDSITARVMFVDSIFSTDNRYRYLDTTFIDTLYENGVYRDTATARLIIQGNTATLQQDIISGTMDGSGAAFLSGFPAGYGPNSNSGVFVVMTINVGAFTPGYIGYSSGSNVFYVYSSETDGLFDAGVGGVYGFNISWVID